MNKVSPIETEHAETAKIAKSLRVLRHRTHRTGACMKRAAFNALAHSGDLNNETLTNVRVALKLP